MICSRSSLQYIRVVPGETKRQLNHFRNRVNLVHHNPIGLVLWLIWQEVRRGYRCLKPFEGLVVSKNDKMITLQVLLHLSDALLRLETLFRSRSNFSWLVTESDLHTRSLAPFCLRFESASYPAHRRLHLFAVRKAWWYRGRLKRVQFFQKHDPIVQKVRKKPKAMLPPNNTSIVIAAGESADYNLREICWRCKQH